MRSVILYLILASSLYAQTTYYVRTDGDNGNAGTTNSSGGAWRNVDYAADNVAAGDTIRVQAGTFVENVTPAVTGTAGNPITFVADGVAVTDTWTLTNMHYIRIIGFTIDAYADGDTSGTQEQANILTTGTCSYLEIWNNIATHGRVNGIRQGSSDVLNNCLIIGNTFIDIGLGGSGSAVGVNISGVDNIVAHNTFDYILPDAMTIKGDRNRFLNNYTVRLSEDEGGHSDVFQSGSSSLGLEYNLFEATFQEGTGASEPDEHPTNISNSVAGGGPMTENIFRGNIWHNTGSSASINQAFEGDISYTRWYHNDSIELLRGAPTQDRGLVLITTGVNNTHIFNNIEYESWGTSQSTNVEVYYSEGSVFINGNLAYDPDGPITFDTVISRWIDQVTSQDNADPDFNDVAGDDFTLGASSNATDNAVALTAVNETSGTGTSFDVDDAGFFRGDNTAIDQYGGNLILGDTITIGTDVRRIVSISGDRITVDSELSWEDDDLVYYGDDATPDIGAYPADHVPLTEATISQDGNDYEVNPDGDTRWVVFFVDKIPHTVDNEAPYEATISSGDVTAKAFALRASKTPVVTATLTSSPPSSPLKSDATGRAKATLKTDDSGRVKATLN